MLVSLVKNHERSETPKTDILSNFWTIYMKISGGRPLLDKKALHKNGDFHNLAYKT